jgi:hypothetical protein
VGSPPALPSAGTSGRPDTLPSPRALRAPSPAAHHRRRVGEAEREGASVASGWGGEGAGPEVPEGGSERGGGGGWGAEGRSEPFQGSHISVPLSLPSPVPKPREVVREPVRRDRRRERERNSPSRRAEGL